MHPVGPFVVLARKRALIWDRVVVGSILNQRGCRERVRWFVVFPNRIVVSLREHADIAWVIVKVLVEVEGLRLGLERVVRRKIKLRRFWWKRRGDKVTFDGVAHPPLTAVLLGDQAYIVLVELLLLQLFLALLLFDDLLHPLHLRNRLSLSLNVCELFLFLQFLLPQLSFLDLLQQGVFEVFLLFQLFGQRRAALRLPRWKSVHR